MPKVKQNTNSAMRLYAISMIRNEFDIIEAFLNQAVALFDKIYIVDIRSTDGTYEIISAFGKKYDCVECFSVDTQERYQAAMMNNLALKAANEGADWVFFLDGDEFVNVEDRSQLEKYLVNFRHEVIYMPWVNLIPSKYGDFSHFDMAQQMNWSGRVSPFNKVAVRGAFFLNNPSYSIHEGNHGISPNSQSNKIDVSSGLTLLHLPIRSIERLKYKLEIGLRLLESKHNLQPGEGNHASNIMSLLAERDIDEKKLNSIASEYGVNENKTRSIDPKRANWPTKTLPAFVMSSQKFSVPGKTLNETSSLDARMIWNKPNFVSGSPIMARLEKDMIRFIPQPCSGKGEVIRESYGKLDIINPDLPTELGVDQLIESVVHSFIKLKVFLFSAWSQLTPTLFCLFSFLKPRRYVELGVHNGVSFFAACQVAERMNLDAQCVAVDCWIGDPHAGFHSEEVFETFRGNLQEHFPSQHYIKAYFEHASHCFEDESIDLLHIDGFHSYEAVRADFETWLPKMSQSGVVIFHDINVHQNGFGVWRYWEELKEKYPSISLYHCHGLGILYTGNRSNSILKLFKLLKNNNQYAMLAQQYLESLGELAIEYRSLFQSTQPKLPTKKFFKSPAQGARTESAGLFSNRGVSEISGIGSNTLNNWQLKFKEAKQRNGWLRSQLERRRAIRTIRKSNYFDSEFYLRTNPDVKEAGVDPVVHFVDFGAAELRNPHPAFDLGRYLLNNEDVLNSLGNPLIHYLEFGINENRAL